MDQEIRNKLRNVVTQCRKLLEDSVSQELEGKYGIFAKKDHVTADPDATLTHLTEEEQTARKDILDHFGHIKARGFTSKEALDQLVREIAFTHLNRLCAYKMMEAREVYIGGQKFREAVSRGINSNGVKFYLADHPEEERLFNTGHQDIAYRHFLDWLGGLLSDEIGVLFSPNDPANRLYPKQMTLDEVLNLLNSGDIKPDETELREAWPKIWSQDETIGWVYQYFTPKELRDAARDPKKGGSQAPRNSYELAFRNQFFTPRYVVEFLTDNTLGRIWYEMRKGNTKLKDQCRYLVRSPTEIFLEDGEEPPKAAAGQDDLSQEELLKLPAHIPWRAKKDPRELKILDPACGSGHFLLYCFDLLQTIYEEAYTDPDLGSAIQKDYPKLEDLQRDTPRLILAHNLHGIDIDVRARQISALALWLRCQRAYQEMGLKKDRPQIKRSNVVCAEPMPGEGQMLKEFVAQLQPKVLGHLVEIVFDKMKLAGEAGSLLKIEEELRDAIADARQQWVAEHELATDRKGQPLLFTRAEMERLSHMTPQPQLFDFSEITDEQFWNEAESQVLAALRSYSAHASNGGQLQRQLFAEDAARGFAFIDVSQKRFDVVLMNPPYGEPIPTTKHYCKTCYPQSHKDVFGAFFERSLTLASTRGRIGALTSRTWLQNNSFAPLREEVVLRRGFIDVIADLGVGVLDSALVETAASVIENTVPYSFSLFARLHNSQDKAGVLSTLTPLVGSDFVFAAQQVVFTRIPTSPLTYWLPPLLRRHLSDPSRRLANFLSVKQGLATGDDFRFIRASWEVAPGTIGRNKKWNFLSKGGEYSPWFFGIHLVVDWEDDGYSIRNLRDERGKEISRYRGADQFFLAGLTYPFRTVKGFNVRVLPKECLFTIQGPSIVSKGPDKLLSLAFLNSAVCKVYLESLTSFGAWQVGYLQLVPYFEPKGDAEQRVKEAVAHIVRVLMRQERSSETSPSFVAPEMGPGSGIKDVAKRLQHLREKEQQEVQRLEGVIQEEYAKLVDLSLDDLERLCNMARSSGEEEEVEIDEADHANRVGSVDGVRICQDLVSYCVGAALGRWNVQMLATQQVDDSGEANQNPFEALPTIPPGMCGSATVASVGGMIPDDSDHSDDIVRRVRGFLELGWKDRAEAIEKEACEIVGVKELRDYFRKPGKGGFWDDHISRYSKSRRKAPIYWLLQSSEKTYSLWLYYHRLDKDLLFKALVNYVEPKIRLETSRLETLRNQKAAAGESGTEAKRLAKDVERLEDVLSELRDFEDKLRRAASLHLEPDLNDGVVLNIAPLWELVPWKEAKNYWEELLKGKYEWSSMAKQLRQKGLVK